MSRRLLPASGLLVLLAIAPPALGAEDYLAEDASTRNFLLRPHGMAEIGLGWLTLPGAQVCAKRSEDSCSEGDSSPAVEVWQLFRASPALAFGAGITLGLIPTTDAPRNDPPGVERDHERSYFGVEGIARYYPLVNTSFEAWLGVTGGLVVLSDHFSTASQLSDRAFVGPRGVTIRTEGYAVGVAAGTAYRFAPAWSVGGNLRFGSWFFPQEPERDVFGDEASLSGRNSMFALVITIAYRIAL